MIFLEQNQRYNEKIKFTIKSTVDSPRFMKEIIETNEKEVHQC